MLICIAKFWKEGNIISEHEIKAKNISELNYIAFTMAKETETNYSLGEIKEEKENVN